MLEETFLISRTDAIGDVVLTLPLAGWTKSVYPEAKVVFLGRTYTQPVVACCRHVNAFLNADELLELHLHLAAAAGDQTLGLYPPMRPVHPGRWETFGERASFLAAPKICEACRSTPASCACLAEISVEAVMGVVRKWGKTPQPTTDQ